MNALINWLNKHVVPIAAKIGSIRWLVALRDAFISLMPLIMAGAVANVLNAIFRDVPFVIASNNIDPNKLDNQKA